MATNNTSPPLPPSPLPQHLHQQQQQQQHHRHHHQKKKRAICHRTDTLVDPLASFRLDAKAKVLPCSLLPGKSGKTDVSIPQATTSCKSNPNFGNSGWSVSSEAPETDPQSDFSFPSPLSSSPSVLSVPFAHSKVTEASVSYDCVSVMSDEDSGLAYSSIPPSPFSSTCSSRSSLSSNNSPYFSSRYSSEDYGNEGNTSDVKRVPSWSDLFRHSGGEHAVSAAEKWMIDLSQLFFGQRFASGTYSRLYFGTYKGEAVAVKVMRQPDEDEFMSDILERLFTQEITMQSRLDHRNIVKFVGACRKPPALCMLMEYLPGGSLRAFLHKANEPLRLKQLLGMALDIASGMEYLHTSGLVHRDLKSENLLLTDDLRVKIADFGVACFESDHEFMRDGPGTYRWMAPEMISRKPFSRKVDVFSFGMVLYELLSRHVPFEEMSAVQAAFAIVHKNARPSIPSNCPALLERLICQCWACDPNQRPEFWEILKLLQNLEDALED